MSFQPIVFHNSWAELSSIWAFFSCFFFLNVLLTLLHSAIDGGRDGTLKTYFPSSFSDWLLLDPEYRDMWVSPACERRMETFSSLLACLAVCVSDMT